jgi:prepilin-type processing-associated H-X9-DG protein
MHDVYGALPPFDLWYVQNQSTPYSHMVGGGDLNTNQWYVSMFVVLLPYIEQSNLINAVTTGSQINWWEHTKKIYRMPLPKTFICPSDGSNPGNQQVANWGPGDYAGNFLIFGNPTPSNFNDPYADHVFGVCTKLQAIPDGTSNTFFITEKYQVCKIPYSYCGCLPMDSNDSVYQAPAVMTDIWSTCWAPAFAMSGPRANNPGGWNDGTKFQTGVTSAACNSVYPQSYHTGIVNMAMADGSVRTISQGIDALTWQLGCRSNDGLPITLP